MRKKYAEGKEEIEEGKMKIFMIGGTGLLGSEAARELIARGHE